MSLKTQIIGKTYTYTISVNYRTENTILDPISYFQENLVANTLANAGLSPVLEFVDSTFLSVTTIGGVHTYSWVAKYSSG